jgi:hypothetical protein
MGDKGFEPLHARLLTFLLPAAISGVFAAVACGEPSRIDLGGRVAVEIGEHMIGDRFTSTVSLLNPLNEPVRITEIKSSCGCLSAKVSPTAMAPGGTAAVQVDVDGLGIVGVFDKAVLLRTDNKTLPLVRLVLRGRFMARDRNLFCLPAEISLDQMQPGQLTEQVVAVRRSGMPDVGTVRLLPSAGYLSAQVDSKRSTDKTVYFTVRISAPAAGTEIRDEILIQGPEADDFVRLPIRTRVAEPMVVTPNRCLLVANEQTSRLYVTRRSPAIGGLRGYFVASGDVEVVSCEESGWPNASTVLTLRTGKLHDGFNQGLLLLEFDGSSALSEIQLVGWVDASGTKPPSP